MNLFVYFSWKILKEKWQCAKTKGNWNCFFFQSKCFLSSWFASTKSKMWPSDSLILHFAITHSITDLQCPFNQHYKVPKTAIFIQSSWPYINTIPLYLTPSDSHDTTTCNCHFNWFFLSEFCFNWSRKLYLISINKILWIDFEILLLYITILLVIILIFW